MVKSHPLNTKTQIKTTSTSFLA